jgi:hypothetical protein
MSALNGINNPAVLWARAQTLIMEEKQKQLKLSQQHQQHQQQQQKQISPKNNGLLSGTKRPPPKDEDVRFLEITNELTHHELKSQ